MKTLQEVEQGSSGNGQSPVALAWLKVGEKGLVRHIKANGDRVVRLMKMGLIPGTMVCVNGVAPLGDPLQLTLRACNLSMRGYDLSIRRSEAERIEVDYLP